MSFISWKGLAVVLVATVGFYLRRQVSKPDLPPVLGGHCHPAFNEVKEILRRNVESGKEPGAAYAVYHAGVPVVDLWAGYADVEAQRPWRQDTVTLVFSITKAVAAIVVAKMVENGVLDYKENVTTYWPEFGQHGKGNVTVEMLLSHQAGLVLLDTPLSLREIRSDIAGTEARLAAQKPVWPPGTQFGYHAITFGLYIDRLIQKADRAGRDTATIFQEDIAKPFGIDFKMNLSRSEYHRAARIYPRAIWRLLLDSWHFPRYRGMIKHILFYPDSLLARCMSAVTEYSLNTNTLNDPENRDVTISSASGSGTARALARLFGILANDGVTPEGKRLLGKDSIDKLSRPVITGQDVVMATGETSRYGPGMIFSRSPRDDLMFGHTGHGGQVLLGDVTNKVGVAYLTNHCSIHGVADDPRYVDLLQATYRALDKYKDIEGR